MFYNNIFLNKNKINKIINIHKKCIDRVGLKNLSYPFIFDNNKGKLQRASGMWNIGISLLKYKRGIHMSRLVSILDFLLLKNLNLKYFFNFHKFFLYEIWSNDLTLQVSFMYFLKKYSPIKNCVGLLNYKLTLFFEKNNIFLSRLFKIVVPVNSLCPCSKSISSFNSHNQRSYVSFFLFLIKNKNVDIDKIIHYIEDNSTLSLWSVLKRNDEKYFTEFSYRNPKFVEDITRNIFHYFKKKNFFLKIENMESIHNHNVYTYLRNF